MMYQKHAALQVAVQIFIVLLLSPGCRPQPASEQTPAPPEAPVIRSAPRLGWKTFCYVTADDTVILSVLISENGISGSYTTAYANKDRNTGRLENAFMKNDTMIADFRFMSEGKQSVRKVAFLIQDTLAREGFGKVVEREGKQVFAQLSALKFDKSPILTSGNCKDKLQ